MYKLFFYPYTFTSSIILFMSHSFHIEVRRLEKYIRAGILIKAELFFIIRNTEKSCYMIFFLVLEYQNRFAISYCMDSLKLISSDTEQILTNKRTERKTRKQMKRGVGRQTLYRRIFGQTNRRTN